MRLSHLAIITALISILGFFDAAFLTVEHLRGSVPPCFAVDGCAVVTTSAYSTILGVPVALLGALFYLAVFIGSILFLDTRRASILRFTALLTPLGFLFSLWFLYVQAFVLHAFCSWCLVSAVTSTLLFIIGIVIELHHRTFREKVEELLNK